MMELLSKLGWTLLRVDSKGHIFLRGGHWDDIVELPGGWTQLAIFVKEMEKEERTLWG